MVAIVKKISRRKVVITYNGVSWPVSSLDKAFRQIAILSGVKNANSR